MPRYQPSVPRHGPAAAAVFLVLLACLAPRGVAAQSVVHRSPNVPGGWVGPPGVLHLGLLHRFDGSDEAPGAVEASPVFFGGLGFRGYGLVGARWATGSAVVPGKEDEWEILARLSPLSTAAGAAFDVSLTAAWNGAATSLDGELGLGTRVGPAKVTGIVRGLSDGFGQEEARWAVGASAVLTLSRAVSIAADVVRPTDLDEGDALAWGAGVQLAVPGRPLGLSLQLANTTSSTLQGSSVRSSGTRFGFEATIALSPARLFGRGGPTDDPTERAGEVDVVAGDTVRIVIGPDGFVEETVTVRPGTYVSWRNESDAIQSVVADSGGWRSPLMAPSETFGRVFTEPGEHPYHSGPRPTTRGTIVVRGPRDAP